jgi:glycerol-3-phosphate dehydrogenase
MTAVNPSAPIEFEVAVVGAGVVGAAAALALSRRGVTTALLEAEPEPGLAASGTNSGVLHTGFDSHPGELETELILRSAELRPEVTGALGIPVLRCGALMRPLDPAQEERIAALAANAARNGVDARLREDGALEVPGEAITDPVAHTLALARAATAHGAILRTGFRVEGVSPGGAGFILHAAGGERVGCRVLLNCAGLRADEVARAAGDESFEIYPRKGEFLVFDPGPGDRLDRVLLPVPSERTKGVLVFPTLDGKVVAGPTAVDQADKGDWSVRPEAEAEIMPKVVAMHPPLEGAAPIAAYAGLRPAGRAANYLIGASRVRPGLVNAAAIRSTGLTASLGIAERLTEIVAGLGIRLAEPEPLRASDPPSSEVPWWHRTAEYRAAAASGTR